jgi:hypothetical protein
MVQFRRPIMAKKKNQPEWKPKKVNGKTQRARTYAPGWDVICVRAPSGVIDKIRSEGKKVGSISKCVAAKFGFKLEGRKKKSSAKKTSKPKKTATAKKAKTKTAPNHVSDEKTEGAHAPAETPF